MKVKDVKVNEDGTVSYTVTEKPNKARIAKALEAAQARKAELEAELSRVTAEVERLTALVSAIKKGT